MRSIAIPNPRSPHAPLGRRLSPRQFLNDPRQFQIVSLAGLLLYGITQLGFDVTLTTAGLLIVTALATQFVFCRRLAIGFDARSPLITALSVTLLARATSVGWLAAVIILAVASKFSLCHRGKHLFNPAAFGIASTAVLTGHVWISPGQWGQSAIVAFALVCLGGTVVHRALRSDVTAAFLLSYGALVLGRTLWLGDPLPIAAHRLSQGALLLFAFFMISDPKTTPDRTAGRWLYGALVATVAATIHFGLHQPNGFLFALIGCALFVPQIDRIFAGQRYHWPASQLTSQPTNQFQNRTTEHSMYRATNLHSSTQSLAVSPARQPARTPSAIVLVAGFLLAISLFSSTPSRAFCGFYVAKADAQLFNQASRVVLARNGDRTVVTMANDYRGEPEEFAIVIPVPTLIEREQIHVAESALIDHLDAFTAPRLVEYYDQDPCQRTEDKLRALGYINDGAAPLPSSVARYDRELGVTIEATYTVGEYDILILSAEQSHGLTTWLRQNEYRLPDGAEEVLSSYLKQGMRFFVAKVNLGEQERLGVQSLRPLQIAYESPKFMLPIRLGMLNAKGAQELFVYTLTPNGRVETVNYRTVKLPTGNEVPTFVKGEFGEFYSALFDRQFERDGGRGVFLEYSWDMRSCDPCVSEPLSSEQLRALGAYWPEKRNGGVHVTRLHLRYDEEQFPDDLRFQETGDRSNFQARYVLRHPWTGSATCSAGRQYLDQLAGRFDREATELARLTGWSRPEIRERIEVVSGISPVSRESWWQKLWPSR